MNLLEIFEDSEDLLKFTAGSTIFEAGSKGDFMYVVMEGTVQYFLADKAVAEETPGGIVGEMALIDTDTRSATAKALTDCVLVPIDRHSFKLLIQHTPDFAIHVISVLAERLRHANAILAG